jgi:uncharacterized alkaline shock family protein YloU
LEVLALVGAAGTGKSHRALLVAERYEADLIIDDGLLIKGGKILAGKSAKREQTQMAAVRRAIFSNQVDRELAKQVLSEQNPQRVLVLGTSQRMVDLITAALDLPKPKLYVSIEEVSSPSDIRRAKRYRTEEGKHVIPAPTFEVKRGFSGYLVDPLRLFMKGKAKSKRRMLVEKSVVRPSFSSLGRFFIADTVIVAIASRAGREHEAIDKVLRVEVDSTSEGVFLTMELSVRLGFHLPDVLRQVQERVREVVEYQTALNVLAVDAIARKVSLDEVGKEN